MEPQSPAVTSPAPVESVPSTWPGAFGIFKHSRAAVRRNIWAVLGLGLSSAILSFIIDSFGVHKTSAGQMSGSSIVNLIGWLFSVLLSTALMLVVLAAVRGNKLSIGEALSKSMPLYLKVLALTILTVFIAVGSFLLFVVPFFIILPRLGLALYFLVDQNVGPLDALKASWEATKGNVGKVWGIIGATLLMALLVFVIVGIYFLFMYSAAFAVLYLYLTKDKGTSATVETTVVPASGPQL